MSGETGFWQKPARSPELSQFKAIRGVIIDGGNIPQHWLG